MLILKYFPMGVLDETIDGDVIPLGGDPITGQNPFSGI